MPGAFKMRPELIFFVPSTIRWFGFMMNKPAENADSPPPFERGIVDMLETDIIFGRLHPRERLVEDALMDRFAASRHKIRRVIAELVTRGLAEQKRNKGASVRYYSRTEVEELYEIRNTLQSQAISRMSLPVDQEPVTTLGTIQSAHARSSQENRLEETFQLNNEFHELFFSFCGNRLLAEAIRNYTWKTHPFRSRQFFDARYRSESVQDHADMVTALIEQDRPALLELNLRHTNRPRDMYLQMTL